MIAKTSAVAESFLNVPCRNSFLSRPTPGKELRTLLKICVMCKRYFVILIINIIYNLNNVIIHFQNQPFSKKNATSLKKIPTAKIKPLIINQIQYEKFFLSAQKKYTYKQKIPTAITTAGILRRKFPFPPFKYITYSFNLPLA